MICRWLRRLWKRIYFRFFVKEYWMTWVYPLGRLESYRGYSELFGLHLPHGHLVGKVEPKVGLYTLYWWDRGVMDQDKEARLWLKGYPRSMRELREALRRG